MLGLKTQKEKPGEDQTSQWNVMDRHSSAQMWYHRFDPCRYLIALQFQVPTSADTSDLSRLGIQAYAGPVKDMRSRGLSMTCLLVFAWNHGTYIAKEAWSAQSQRSATDGHWRDNTGWFWWTAPELMSKVTQVARVFALPRSPLELPLQLQGPLRPAQGDVETRSCCISCYPWSWPATCSQHTFIHVDCPAESDSEEDCMLCNMSRLVLWSQVWNQGGRRQCVQCYFVTGYLGNLRVYGESCQDHRANFCLVSWTWSRRRARSMDSKGSADVRDVPNRELDVVSSCFFCHTHILSHK